MTTEVKKTSKLEELATLIEGAESKRAKLSLDDALAKAPRFAEWLKNIFDSVDIGNITMKTDYTVPLDARRGPDGYSESSGNKHYRKISVELKREGVLLGTYILVNDLAGNLLSQHFVGNSIQLRVNHYAKEDKNDVRPSSYDEKNPGKIPFP